MKKIILSLTLIAGVLFSGTQAQAAGATATVTAKVYLPISLSVVDHGNYVFNRTSMDPAWTGTTNLNTTTTVYPKIAVGGEPSAAVTVTVPAITWQDGSANIILSTSSTLTKCSTLATGTFPSTSCAFLPAGGTTNIWIAPVTGATNHAAAVVLNNSGIYTAVATVQVDY